MNPTQTESYLSRIQYKKEIKPDAETLGALIQAHLETIPFENIDIYDFKRIPSLKEEDLFDKIINRKRGGYCFELNTLFAEFLKALGYSVYPVAARIQWNRDTIRPLGHIALVVTIGECSYLCDVGYGGPGPKGLIRISEEEQTVCGASFRFRIKKDLYRLERLHHGEWKLLFCFENKPYEAVDFVVLSHYCASSEDMIFSRERILNLCTPGGSKALTGMELKITENGNTAVTTYQTMEELQAGIEKEFGISSEIWKH